jgi:hypothetical protein
MKQCAFRVEHRIMLAIETDSLTEVVCPDCGALVRHRSDFQISTLRNEVDEGIRTRLIANGTLLLHTCTSTLSAWLDKGPTSAFTVTHYRR